MIKYARFEESVDDVVLNVQATQRCEAGEAVSAVMFECLRCCGCLLRMFVADVCCGCLLRMFVADVCCGCLLRMFVADVCCGCLLRMFVAECEQAADLKCR